MRPICWVFVAVALALLVLHGLLGTSFVVDATSVILLVLLSIPCIAHYLKKAEIGGAKFEFRDEINKIEASVQRSVEQARRRRGIKTRKSEIGTFDLDKAREASKLDPTLGLAALRIEIETTLKRVAARFDINGGASTSLVSTLNALQTREKLSNWQVDALRRILRVCNAAIHGGPVDNEEVEEIFSLTKELNSTF